MTAILCVCVSRGRGGALGVNQILLQRCRAGRPFDKFRKYSIGTNVFGIYHKALYIWTQNRNLIKILFVVILSNFAYAKTDKLPWHVQNYDLIGLLL